jgi:tetratricopeptide (TPR) repeat protein
MMRGEFTQAIPHLLKAEKLDPKLKVALIYVSHAYWNQGQAAKADEFAKIVEKSRAELSTYERLILDLTQTYVRGDHEAQLRIARQMVAFSKKAITIYLNASSANRNNCPREAVAVLSQYNPNDPAMKDWSHNYWRVLTTAHHMLGNHKRELKEARRGRKQFPENLRILACEVNALAALGRMKDLQKLFAESSALPPAAGYSPGHIMLYAGRELRAHGFKEDSVQVLNQALRWFEGRPAEEKGTAGNRYARAMTLYVLGKWSEAKTLFEGLQSEVPENISYLGYLGEVTARLGDRDGALKVSKQLEEDHQPYLFGNPTYWRARFAALLGDKEGAVNLLRQTTMQGFDYSSLHPTEDFESLADYPPYIQIIKPKG